MVDRSGQRGEVDWDDVKRRLAEARARMENLDELTPEQSRAKMDERARRLAAPPQTDGPAEAVIECVTFRLGQEIFALETRFVRELWRPNSLTEVPGGPEFLVGLTNHKGEILAALDLRSTFGQEVLNRYDATHTMCVVGEDRDEFGLLVDEIRDVVTLESSAVLPPPEALPSTPQNLTAGVTRDGLLVLDGHALLTDESLLMNEVD